MSTHNIFGEKYFFFLVVVVGEGGVTALSRIFYLN